MVLNITDEDATVQKLLECLIKINNIPTFRIFDLFQALYICTVFIRIEPWSSTSYKWFLTHCLNESGIYLNLTVSRIEW